MATERSYSWACITYMDEGNLRRFLTEQCRNWAWIVHDRDVKEDGTPKEVHKHVVCTFERERSFGQVVQLFAMYAEGQNTLVEPCQSLEASLEYLTHENDPQKWQYDRKEVIISSSAWYGKYIGAKERAEENEKFVNDLLAPSSRFSVVAMARTYGRDFMRNMRSYMEFRKVALYEEMGGNALDYFMKDSEAEAFNDISKE